jgi:hypothetical protein
VSARGTSPGLRSSARSRARRSLLCGAALLATALALLAPVGVGLGPVARAQTPVGAASDAGAPDAEPLLPDAAALPTEQIEITVSRGRTCPASPSSPAPPATGPRARGCGCG